MVRNFVSTLGNVWRVLTEMYILEYMYRGKLFVWKCKSNKGRVWTDCLSAATHTHTRTHTHKHLDKQLISLRLDNLLATVFVF